MVDFINLLEAGTNMLEGGRLGMTEGAITGAAAGVVDELKAFLYMERLSV